MRSLIIVLASGGFLGYAPVASGTFGTLAGIPLLFLLHPIAASSGFLYVLLLAAFIAFSCWVAGQAEGVFDEHDSGKIVIDEVCGFLATMLFMTPSWTNVIVAFFVFRIADVIKPYPASAIDASWPGGPGVVLDDVVSGLYSCVFMHLLVLIGILS